GTVIFRVTHMEPPSTGSSRVPGQRRRERVRRVVHLLILTFAAIMLIDAVVGDQGVVALSRARRELTQLSEQVQRLHAENEAIQVRNRRLRDDAAALEEAVRRDLGLMKRGEKVFIIRDLPSPPQP
ncbi:MAG: septum formation initiator family protein, partial [Vicinamibacterales bacterium]